MRQNPQWDLSCCPAADPISFGVKTQEPKGQLATTPALPWHQLREAEMGIEQFVLASLLALCPGLEGADPRPQNSPRGDRDNSDDKQLKMSALPRGNYDYI